MRFKLKISGLFMFALLASTTLFASYKTEIYVALDGSGDYLSIQEAIDNAKSFPEKRINIYIRNGTYHEKIIVPDWNPNISLIGESREKTIISWDDDFTIINRSRNSTFFTPTLAVYGDYFYAADLTVINGSEMAVQAVALALHGDNAVIINCTIPGNQDTLFLTGVRNRQFLKQCTIEGTTDFIFGDATAFFEECTILSKANSYITAAASSRDKPFGFVFYKCHMTAAPGISKVYLGRPWRNYAKVAFLFCHMEEHIMPEGWHNWGSEQKAETSIFREFGNTGPGANISQRVAFMKSTDARDLTEYTREQVLNSHNQRTFEYIKQYLK